MPRSVRSVLAIAASVALATPAMAQARKLISLGSPTIVVWKDLKAQTEGYRLLEAGVHRMMPELIMPLISCMPDAGAEFSVREGGSFSSDIMIVSGRDAGCRGIVPNDYLGKP